ncbi:lipopolysaccharide 1,2-glucosyltransferase, partial [Salmonella enterica subsp. enterica serovar Infantis]
MDSFPEIEIEEYKIFYESNNNNDYNVLNISYGVDENYLDGLGVSIASDVLNNNIPLAF